VVPFLLGDSSSAFPAPASEGNKQRGRSGRTNSARGDEMLRVVAPLLSQMLHIKSLTINVVAGVAGF
jgi:hypothetical protein